MAVSLNYKISKLERMKLLKIYLLFYLWDIFIDCLSDKEGKPKHSHTLKIINACTFINLYDKD